MLGSGEVAVSVTGGESLLIETEDNIMPLLTTEVRNGRLELGSESSFSTTRGIKYTITVVSLEGVEINGSGDVAATGVDADWFVVDISGSGDIRIEGVSRELDVGISGSGRFHGEDLVASIGTVKISGNGTAVVNVTEHLTASIGGSGDIEYLGDPSLDESVSGSGEVNGR